MSFISLVFAHELRPNIANLDITKNEKTTDAKLNLKINLEAIIVGIDPNHSNTKESDQSDLYDEYRKLSSDALLEKFNEKFNNSHEYTATIVGSASFCAKQDMLTPSFSTSKFSELMALGAKKIFNSDSGKLILSNTHSITKLKGNLIIKKND